MISKNRPVMKISKSKVFENLNKLKEVVDEVSYSWKTNPYVGKILNGQESCYMSIHSLNELKNVEKKTKVWYFLTAGSVEELDELKKLEISQFVVDNRDDLEFLINYIEEQKLVISLLLRMKLREHSLSTGKHFVYGMDSKTVNEQILKLRNHKNITQLGVHFHRKTQNVNEWSLKNEFFNSLSQEALQTISLVNIGGGFPGYYKNIPDSTVPTILSKVKELRESLREYDIKLFAEPGRFIACSAATLTCEITAVHDDTLFVNWSIFSGAMDTVVANIKLLVEGELESGKRYVVKGCTPDSADILRYSVYLEDPQKGDQLTFLNVGAYIYTTNFCDVDLPEIHIIN